MRAVDDLERAEKLDGLTGLGQRWARSLRPGRFRDALHGVWLGHPLHPMLAQAPIGLWLSATVLDAWPRPGGEQASRRLVLAGLATAAPAALAGAVDWSEQHEQQMRVGAVHAIANGAAIGLCAASLSVRARPVSRALRLAGLASAGVAGLLGGHISFRLAGGANQAEPVPHLVGSGWHDLMPAAEFTGTGPVKRMLGEVPVVVVRDGGEVRVLAERCSHLSGPLSEGELSDGCLTCPWHGSVFRVSDGAVLHGPATAPQPAFAVRVAGGVLQVCLEGAG
jgi:nitrite reductase/ring-hydroxylating ferredoxin subunit